MLWYYIQRGGIMMYPLLLCSVVSLAIIIERFVYYYFVRKKIRKLFILVEEYVKQRDWEKVKSCIYLYPSILGEALLAGVEKYTFGGNTAEVEEAMKSAAELGASSLERYLPLLSLIGSLSTLLGFTGTVTGMINAFNNIVEQGTSTPIVVAGGIAEALITTATGLFIAIPTIAAYFYFSYNVEQIVVDVEKKLNKLCKYF
jgi:biopolymer transport protein ExbB